MRYYAVTDDPNELLHYGVKGMKWGKHLFGEDLKPKSQTYKSALGKLRNYATNKKNEIKVRSSQRAAIKQKRQQDRYEQAVKKAQRNIEISEHLFNIDNDRVRERGIDRDYWSQVKAAKIVDKAKRKYDRNERKMDKYIQQAREGNLHYGKLSDEQVNRITERLALEQNARKLGSTEKPSWHQQKKEAKRAGMLQGITKGTAASMEEIARAGTIYGIQHFRNRRKLNAAAKQAGKQEHIKNVAKNKKTNKEIRDELKQEAYESEIRSGKGFWERGELGRHMSSKRAVALLQENNQRANEQKNLQSQWQNYLEENGLTDREALKNAKNTGNYKGNDNDIRRMVVNNDRKTKQFNEEQNKRLEEEQKKHEEQEEQRANEEAYRAAIEEAQRRFDNEEKEKKNEQLKEKYDKDMEKYKRDKQYDEDLKADYEERMKNYDRLQAIWDASDDDYKEINEAPKKPEEPKYRNTEKPSEPNYERIDNSLSIPSSYDQYRRMREFGLVPQIFNNGNNNNNGKKPRRNK